jgi:K+-sensing histidine kinase KdpD
MEPVIDLVKDPTHGELEALTEVAKVLVSAIELSDLLDTVMQTIVRVLEQADIGAIMLWDQPAGVLRAAAAFGYDLDTLRKLDLLEDESITGNVFQSGEVNFFSSPEEVLRAMENLRPNNREIMAQAIGSEQLPQTAIAAPITAGDRKYGVLVLEALDSEKPFKSENAPFVQTLADLVALAIDRDRLKQQADATREARRAERFRSEIMATLSHELRMPLSMIKGYASALLMEELNWKPEKHREFLDLIENACDDMEGMIRDILDTALIEVDQLNIEPQTCDIQLIASEIAQETKHRSPKHRPVVDIPASFPLVIADPRWIKQVFRNILDNAVKYSPDGGLIVIQGQVREKDVVIRISDQGVGISSEDLIPIFERYFRARSESTLHISGTGLGLAIARSIVEAHKGHIWIESKENEGTTVFFSLPLVPHDEVEG